MTGALRGDSESEGRAGRDARGDVGGILGHDDGRGMLGGAELPRLPDGIPVRVAGQMDGAAHGTAE